MTLRGSGRRLGEGLASASASGSSGTEGAAAPPFGFTSGPVPAGPAGPRRRREGSR